MTSLISALIEAWEEVKINRVRVILSLFGVGAAVWAMATVIALGSILNAAEDHMWIQYDGYPGTISISTEPAASQDSQSNNAPVAPFAPRSSEDGTGNQTSTKAIADLKNFREAVLKTVQHVQAKHWTTFQPIPIEPDAPEFNECPDAYCSGNPITLFSVDPGFFRMYDRTTTEGRTLRDSDAQLQMNPAVINENMWKIIGSPDLSSYPRIWLSSSHATAVTVVGVIKNTSTYDPGEIYISAQSAPYVLAKEPNLLEYFSYPELRIVAPIDQAEEASKTAPAILQSYLGQGYKTTCYYDPSSVNQSQGIDTIITTVIAGIGSIVILLGALGLLTVSIVTVKNRVREIGIRRAVGASAKRIFFSVFLESVVATTVAGFFGVVASILTLRFVPLESIGIDIGGVAWAYPIHAALLGMIISSCVGALCGIIPATTAIRMRPIDAIRF